MANKKDPKAIIWYKYDLSDGALGEIIRKYIQERKIMNIGAYGM